MGNGSCCSGAVLLWIGAILTLFLTFSPFWLMQELGGTQLASGLFVACAMPYDSRFRDCQFIDLFNGPDWFIACAFMWAIGSGLLLFCAVCSCGLCCCRRGCAGTTSGFACLAGLLFLITVIVYGVELGNLFDRDWVLYYDWSFYLSWLGIILAFSVASLMGGTGANANVNSVNPI